MTGRPCSFPFIYQVRKSTEKYGKLRKITEKYGKVRKSTHKYGKVWKFFLIYNVFRKLVTKICIYSYELERNESYGLELSL